MRKREMFAWYLAAVGIGALLAWKPPEPEPVVRTFPFPPPDPAARRNPPNVRIMKPRNR